MIIISNGPSLIKQPGLLSTFGWNTVLEVFAVGHIYNTFLVFLKIVLLSALIVVLDGNVALEKMFSFKL